MTHFGICGICDSSCGLAVEHDGARILSVPDIERTRHLLILGANPAVSNDSIMTAWDCRRKLGAIRARGGRIVVVDPRRTETAAVADAHHFIRPGTDALFLLSFLHVLFEEGLVRPGRSGSIVHRISGTSVLNGVPIEVSAC